ncbi:MAG TPA: hypothetical protein VEF76_06330 [Patescibacteria group bacterium]|nr:hypothetical protein [Patescibacteria group bacterium]
MDEDFNKAAENRAQWRRKLLDAVAEARRDYSFADAIRQEKWQDAIALHEAGANAHHRDDAALKALRNIDSINAAEALEKIKVPGSPRLAHTPYLVAAQNGRLETLEHGLAKGLTKETLSSALFFALQAKQDTAADLILGHLPPKDMQEKALFALLLARPAEYEAALAARDHDADFFAHFYSACDYNDKAAMALSLEKMIAHRDRLPPQLFMGSGFFDEFMGPPPFMQLAKKVIGTGDEAAIDRLIEVFSDLMPPAYLMLVWALTEQKAGLPLVKHLVEKLAATEGDMYAVVMNLASRPDAARYVAESFPAVAQRYPLQVMRGLLAAPATDLAADVAAFGLTLPDDDPARATLLAAAIGAGNADAEQWLLTQFDATPALLAKLADNTDYKVVRRAVALGADWHGKDDALLWKALGENDSETVAQFPRDAKFSTASTWQVGNAVEAALKRGDEAQLAEILAHCDWKEESKGRVFREFLKLPDGVARAAAHGLLPAELKIGDMSDISGRQGTVALDALVAKGVAIPQKVAAEGLRVAIHRNDEGMIGWFFARGMGGSEDPRSLVNAITLVAEEAGLNSVEKWVTREEVTPAPGIAAEIEATTDLFAGADSLALRAAYSDNFADVMKKAGAQAGFDPALLVSTRDPHGNSLLEILGAHGRLGDILEPAAVWKDRDAVAFIQDNTPAIYHAQVDYSGLKAALDQLRLAERGRDNRFRLK